MKYIFSILMISISLNLYGQIENYREYQKLINQAELHLIRNNKSESLAIYHSVLTKSNGNYCKDIFNGLLLASELSKKDEFFQMLNLLLSKGLANSYIEGVKEFQKYHADPRWAEFLAQNQTNQNIDNQLQSVMNSLAAKDQHFRTKPGSYSVYGDTIKVIDSLNMAVLFGLVAEDQFPGEDKIGVRNFRGSQPYDIVFHHYTQSTSLDVNKPKITALLVNLVLEGKIQPVEAALWLEMQNGEFSAGVFDVMIFNVNGKKSVYYVPLYTEKQRMLIGQCRKLLGMETLEEYYEKVLYKISNQGSSYIIKTQTNIFEVDEAGLIKYTASMKELK